MYFVFYTIGLILFLFHLLQKLLCDNALTQAVVKLQKYFYYQPFYSLVEFYPNHSLPRPHFLFFRYKFMDIFEKDPIFGLALIFFAQ